MTLEFLQKEMQNALKTNDKLRRMVLGDIIASIQKLATAGKTKIEITDTMVDEALIKYISKVGSEGIIAIDSEVRLQEAEII